jgi:hypothetical protein
MLVLVQSLPRDLIRGLVDEDEAGGIDEPLPRAHWARRRATSGRSCSAAIGVFL